MTRLVSLVIGLLLVLVGGCGKNSAGTKVAETYDKNCSQPAAGWRTEKDGTGQRPVFAVVINGAGQVSWGQASTAKESIRDYMNKVGALDPQPQIILEIASNAPCDRVKEIRKIMSASPICQGTESLCSEGRNWRVWERYHDAN